MTMPGVRVEDPVRILYNSVCGGPHRPYVSGSGESSLNSSVVHVIYERRQMYPAFAIEVEITLDDSTSNGATLAASESRPSKRSRPTRSPPSAADDSHVERAASEP